MRTEIKFRAKNSEGNWSVGLPTFISTGNPGNILPDTYLSNFITGGTSVKVDQNTLGMCSGLCDRMDRIIFQDDILNNGDENVLVIWNSSTASFDVMRESGECEPLYEFIESGKCQIEGNNIDNPYLFDRVM